MSYKILPLNIIDLYSQDPYGGSLNGLNAEISSGTVTMIIGPYGAGQSLLLRLCHGLVKPDAGQIFWQGEQAKKPKRHQSFVFKKTIVLNRTVYQNIEYPLKLRNIRKKQRETMVVDALESVGISHLSLRQAVSLSQGETKKLALARALVTQPEVLFLDDPTGGLDPKTVFEIEGVIEAMHYSGIKIIMVSYDLAQARRLAGEVIFMHKGRIVEKASAEKVFYDAENAETKAFLDGELLI